MSWAALTLGGIDLRFTSAEDSPYYVEDTANPPEERIEERYVPKNDGYGAYLAQFNIAEAPQTLDVICLGSTQGEAEANRDALQARIDDAIDNPGTVTFEYQRDGTATLASWLVLGGIVRPRWRVSTGEQILWPAGRFTAPAKVYLTLSRA